MFDQIKKVIFTLNSSLEEIEWLYLQENFETKKIKKGEHLYKPGTIQTHIGFVNSGLFRGYHLNENGEEINIRFAHENTFLTDYAALIKGVPSRYNYQCLEDANIILLPFKKLQEGYLFHKGLERTGRLIAEQILIAQQERIESFQFYTAEERYLNFRKSFPDIHNRLTLSQIASFLGIQRPSLSRIRKQIVQK